ncbi:CDF family Co(II)/Ni(II) efflux transporter DmeF [Hydrogenovibrio sp. 3SP14C1]|uniref:CDF family Co(II)/Ni(II) efflux transporter DmeF n=1 Tax=Hydrogenovibrio sp. 3SP14C1 TaxID=3038774 RepID=UPI002417BE66|nr:CDF family Co(II)/Ni(II) efflux transporter DmeF [Hydrogenovibrio sp. 3SP14C1]MDG4812372.1 CDF family Co(II)/Ni(II) efflux transporter DmeF [Hydrogenovibrio sp. 3SP14C1]
MNQDTLRRFQHSHNFVRYSKKNERQVWIVLVITAVTMVAEIVAGTWYGSMALLADGWHMSTHMVAFGITLFAWRYAMAKKEDPTFSFSTGKVSVLAAYSSAIFLIIVAVMMVVESITRFISPHEIAFNQALIVAAIGLLVNFVSALLLHHDHNGDDDQQTMNASEEGLNAHPHGKDHNHQAAYLHVLADALTSLAAIAALLAGKWLGWNWMDPMMGVVGGIIIFIWAKKLIKETSIILLDHSLSAEITDKIIEKLEENSSDKVVDFHAWKVSADDYAIIIGLVSEDPKSPEYYKAKLEAFWQLKHITIEVNPVD